MSDYTDKLKDPRWQKKRLEIMQRDGFRCFICESGSETLNVHHKLYLQGREYWEYTDDQLVTLCEKDHKAIHSVWPGSEATFGLSALFQAVSGCHSIFISFLRDDRLLKLYRLRNSAISKFAVAEGEASVQTEKDLDNIREKIREIEREIVLSIVRRLAKTNQNEDAGWSMLAKFWGLA